MGVDARIYDAYMKSALSERGLDNGYSLFDFGKESRDTVREELERFLEHAGELVTVLDASQIGRGFWLARNGLPVEFWDQALGSRATELTAIAAAFAPRALSIGPDGTLSFAEDWGHLPTLSP